MALHCSWIVVFFFLPDIIECGNDSYQSLCGIISKLDFIPLDNSLVYNISDGTNEVCIVQNRNITITNAINISVDVYCTNDYSVLANGNSAGGIVFVNSTVSIENVAFINCGTYLSALPRNVSKLLSGSSLLDYPSMYSAAVVFIFSSVCLNKVSVKSSFGFAVIGISLSVTKFTKCFFNSSLHQGSGEIQNGGGEVGSGVLIHFMDNVKTSQNTSLSVVIENSTFSYLQSFPSYHCPIQIHGDVDNSLCFAALTIIYEQKHYQAEVQINETEFANKAGMSLLIVHFHTLYDDQTIVRFSKFSQDSPDSSLNSADSALLTLEFHPDEHQTKNKHLHPLLVEDSVFISSSDSTLSKGSVSLNIQTTDKHSSVTIVFTKLMIKYFSTLDVGIFVAICNFGNVFLTLDSLTIQDNEVSSQISSFGILTLKGVTCIINGTRQFPSLFEGNKGSVIHTVDETNLMLYGYVNFTGNEASSGAAINMKGNSRLYFMGGSECVMSRNHASYLGGAIYAVVSRISNKCAFQFEESSHFPISVIFSNNSAFYGGSSIYAYPVFDCNVSKFTEIPHTNSGLHMYTKFFNLSNRFSKPQLDFSTVPSRINVVDVDNLTRVLYPGQKYCVNVSVKDLVFRNVYGIVNVETLLDITSVRIEILSVYKRDHTEIQLLARSSTDTLNKPINQSIQFSLAQFPNVKPVLYNVSIHPCPVGFSFHSGFCNCSQALINVGKTKQVHPSCDINTRIVTLMSNHYSWVGLINNGSRDSVFGVSVFCPMGQCVIFKQGIYLSEKDKILVYNQERNSTSNVCTFGREGPLCGQCVHGLSLVFGSLDCHVCKVSTNYWLYTLISLVYGLVVVFLLYSLKLTLVNGTLNGLIFIVQLCNVGLQDLIFEGVSISGNMLLKIMYGLLSMLNLDFFIPICLYNGMNMLWKSGLSLLFPVYLLILVILIIILSRYSTWISNRTSHLSVQVLVTLVYLSFFKLLLAIIHVFTQAKIYTDQGVMNVWFWDGSVEYLGTDHTYLVIFSLIVGVPLTVPFIVILLFAKPIQKISWINRCLQPFIDAVHGPYREHKKHWFVLRLLLVVIINVLYGIFRGWNVEILYIIGGSIVGFFLIAQAYARPMKVNVLNILESCIGIIILFLYFMIWYLEVISDFVGVAIMGSACIIFIFTYFLCVVLYHFILVTGILKKLARKIRCRKVEGLTKMMVTSVHRDTCIEHANSHYREELLFDSDD